MFFRYTPVPETGLRVATAFAPPGQCVPPSSATFETYVHTQMCGPERVSHAAATFFSFFFLPFYICFARICPRVTTVHVHHKCASYPPTRPPNVPDPRLGDTHAVQTCTYRVANDFRRLFFRFSYIYIYTFFFPSSGRHTRKPVENAESARRKKLITSPRQRDSRRHSFDFQPWRFFFVVPRKISFSTHTHLFEMTCRHIITRIKYTLYINNRNIITTVYIYFGHLC